MQEHQLAQEEERKRKEEEDKRSRTWGEVAQDAGASLMKGLAEVPRGIVGLTDLAATPIRAGVDAVTGEKNRTITEFLADNNLDLKMASDYWGDKHSDVSKRNSQKIHEAFQNDGIVSGIGEALKNPGTILESAIESLPQMATLAGGVKLVAGKIFSGAVSTAMAAGATEEVALMAGRAAVEKAMPRLAALSSAGEGAQTAGSQAADYAAKGELGARQALSAIGSGVTTAAVGQLSNKIGAKFGLEDVEAGLAASGMREAKDGVFKAAAKGALKEGLLEETPQSATEQMWQNLGQGKPLMDGVAEQAVMGGLSGGLLGAVGGGASSFNNRSAPEKPEAEKTPAEKLNITLPDATGGALDVNQDALLDALGMGDTITHGEHKITRPLALPAPSDALEGSFIPAGEEAPATNRLDMEQPRVVVDAEGNASIERPESVQAPELQGLPAPDSTLIASSEGVGTPAQVQNIELGKRLDDIAQVDNAQSLGQQPPIVKRQLDGQQIDLKAPSVEGVSIPTIAGTPVTQLSDRALAKVLNTEAASAGARAKAQAEIDRRIVQVESPSNDAKPSPLATQEGTTQTQEGAAASAQGAANTDEVGQKSLAVIQPKDKVDPTLAKAYEPELRALAAQAGWSETGGALTRTPQVDGSDKIGRTSWVPNAEWWGALSPAERMSPAATMRAVDKALTGEKMDVQERRTVNALLRTHHEQTKNGAIRAAEFAHMDESGAGAEFNDDAYPDVSDQELDAFYEIAWSAKSNVTEEQFLAALDGRPAVSSNDAIDTRLPEGATSTAEGVAEESQATPRSAEEFGLEGLDVADLPRLNAEARQQEEQAATESRKATRKADADAQLGEFTLTGSDRTADEGAARGQSSLFDESAAKVEPVAEAPKKFNNTGPIEDYGQKIGGAAKDKRAELVASLTQDLPEASEITLSKHFPEPNYEQLNLNGSSNEALATVKALREFIGNKPRKPYLLKAWVEKLKTIRSLASHLFNGVGMDGVNEIINNTKLSGAMELRSKIDFYKALGFPDFTKTNGLELESGIYSTFDGVKHPHGIKKFSISRSGEPYSKTKYFDTFDEAVAFAKSRIASEQASDTPKKEKSLDIYSERGVPGYTIGKKIAAGKYIDLKSGLKTPDEARKYLADNKAELLALLDKKTSTPNERRETNADRTGKEHRDGNVSAKDFADAFGFDGRIELGNSMPQAERQDNLNRAYDAFSDLAELIGIPPDAISLNGTLGIGFGSRGHGGVNPAAAHFEPAKVAINLTRKNGAGSLGHEWWHAVANYFSRAVGSKTGDITSNLRTKHEGIRKEVLDAYADVVKAINNSKMVDRSKELDARRTKNYWSTIEELTARAFESFLIDKAKQNGLSNDYLANILDHQTWNVIEEVEQGEGAKESYPYPTESEKAEINAAFEKLFSTIKVKEENSRKVLYSRTATPQKSTPAQLLKALGSAFGSKLVDRLMARGRKNERGGMVVGTQDAIIEQVAQARAKVNGTDVATERARLADEVKNSILKLPDAIIEHQLGIMSGDDYELGKSGDKVGALRLALKLITPNLVEKVRSQAGNDPIIVGVSSIEASGKNAIPHAAAEVLAKKLNAEADSKIIQSNSPKRTSMDGIERIFNKPTFIGEVEQGRNYVLLDDTITQGGTLSSLAKYIEDNGGSVKSIVALSGKQYSRIIEPTEETLARLREKHGDLEDGFFKATGRQFDDLTESEARYLTNYKSANSIGVRISEANRGRSSDLVQEAVSSNELKKAPPSGGVSNSSKLETKLSADGQMQAFYDPVSGIHAFNSDVLAEDTAHGVFLHEYLHGGLDSDPALRKQFDALTQAAVSNHKAGLAAPEGSPKRLLADEVQRRLESAGETESAEETLTYTVEVAANWAAKEGIKVIDGNALERIAKRFGSVAANLIRDFVSMVRLRLMRAGVMEPGKLTTNDLLMMAKQSAQTAGKGGFVGSNGSAAVAGSKGEKYDAGRVFARLEKQANGEYTNNDDVTLRPVLTHPNGSVAFRIRIAKQDVGFVILQPDGDGFSVLRNIKIDDSKQSKGYGEQVIKAMLATSGGKVDIIDITNGHDDQKDARPFWKKLGARWKNYSTDSTQMDGTLDWNDYAKARLDDTGRVGYDSEADQGIAGAGQLAGDGSGTDAEAQGYGIEVQDGYEGLTPEEQDALRALGAKFSKTPPSAGFFASYPEQFNNSRFGKETVTVPVYVRSEGRTVDAKFNITKELNDYDRRLADLNKVLKCAA
jgi:orotate phosphoribosyltransferase-like protein